MLEQRAPQPQQSTDGAPPPEVAPAKKTAGSFQRLIEACKHKDLKQIQALLERRPELVNRCDRHQRSALHYVSVLVGEQEQAEAATACFDYLASRAEERLWWHQDQDGLSTLHLAVISAHLSMVEHLCLVHPMAGREPKLVSLLDCEQHSPLHWAVLTNNLATVQLLVRAGGLGLLYQGDTNHASPLHYATQFGSKLDHRNHLRRLLRGERSFSIESEQQGGDSPAAAATAAGSDERASGVLEYLVRLEGVQLEARDRDQRSALLWAASSGNRRAIETLLARGADPLTCDTNGLGPLHCAASHGFLSCLEALLEGPESPSFSLNQPDNLGCTPLFYAILSGNQDCVELLIKRGAQLDWQDTKGRTVAHFAALKGQLSALKLLSEAGANLWLPNKLGDLPLHYAIKGGRQQVVKWLLEHSPYEHSVNAINNLGRAPVHLAVQRDDLELLEYLARCGANLNQLAKLREGAPPEAKYETALDLARRLGHRRLEEFLVREEAHSGVQVLSQRHLVRPGAFQSLEMDSPIGFETSCSSVSPKQGDEQREPLVELEATGSTSGDSTTTAGGSSSSMSHSSASSVRADSLSRKQEANTNRGGGGGISYTNDHICASIKCKLYPKEGPEAQEQQVHKPAEVVTNVRVYTSPCQSCHREQTLAADQNHWPATAYYNEPYYDGRQSRSIEEEEEDNDRLPVILSEQELSSSSQASPVHEPEEALRKSSRSPANEEPRFDRFETGGCRRPLAAHKNIASPVGEYIHSGAGLNFRGPRQPQPLRPRAVAGVGPRKVVTPDQQPYYHRVPAKVDSHWAPPRASGINKSPQWNADLYQTHRSTPLNYRSLSRQTVIRSRAGGRRLSGGGAPLRGGADDDELASKVERTIWKYRQETKLFEELQNLKRSQIRSGKANEAVLVKRLLDRLRAEASSQLIGLDTYQGPYTYRAYERYLYDQLRKLSMSNRVKLGAVELKQPADAAVASVVDLEEAASEFQDEQAEQELRRILADSEDRYSEMRAAADEKEAAPEEVVEDSGIRSESQRELVHDRCASVESARSSSSREQLSVHEEAHNLSASILVDALGNLASKSEPPAAVEDAAEAAGLLPPPTEAAGAVLESGAPVEEPLPPSEPEEAVASLSRLSEDAATEATEEQPDDATPAPKDTGLESGADSVGAKRGRRRSVINIGHKIDVIYHDIGIEIEPAEDAAATTAILEEAESVAVEPEVPAEPAEEPPTEELPKGQESAEKFPDKLAEEEPTEEQAEEDPSKEEEEGVQVRRQSSLPQAAGAAAATKGRLVRQAVSVGADKGAPLEEASKGAPPVPLKEAPEEEPRGGARVSRRRAADSSQHRKRARSIPPGVAYRPRVDTDQIHDRWSGIKAEQRQRLRSRSELRQTEERDFLLLYEINQGFSAAAAGSTGDSRAEVRRVAPVAPQASGRQQLVSQWCERRLARIVDARRLRRTLSLPECLLYSNVLLKRLDILRL